MKKQLSIVIVLSFFIGSAVGTPFRGENPFLLSMLQSGCAGMIIGILSTLAFLFFYRNIRKNAAISFFSVIIVIASGTIAASLVLGNRNILFISVMTLLAEICGIFSAVIIYVRTEKINSDLQKAKKRFDII